MMIGERSQDEMTIGEDHDRREADAIASESAVGRVTVRGIETEIATATESQMAMIDGTGNEIAIAIEITSQSSGNEIGRGRRCEMVLAGRVVDRVR